MRFFILVVLKVEIPMSSKGERFPIGIVIGMPITSGPVWKYTD